MHDMNIKMYSTFILTIMVLKKMVKIMIIIIIIVIIIIIKARQLDSRNN
jgi:hypothetical protein